MGTTSEGQVQEFILQRFKDHELVTEWRPIVAVGPHSALPHYTPIQEGAPIRRGDFILIDLGCKEPAGVYADITRVAVFGRDLPLKKKKSSPSLKSARDWL